MCHWFSSVRAARQTVEKKKEIMKYLYYQQITSDTTSACVITDTFTQVLFIWVTFNWLLGQFALQTRDTDQSPFQSLIQKGIKCIPPNV